MRVTGKAPCRKVTQKTPGGGGYDACLETRAAQNLGDLYRVRLQTHTSEDEAREIMVRLEEEEGINDSFILDGVGHQDQ